MIVLGLTGSIGMGKSTTAAMFAAAGDAVHEADAAVHALYAEGGAAVPDVEGLFPGTTLNGAVDRAALAARVLSDAAAMARLEAVVHPLVRAAEKTFLAAVRTRIAVLDVPLLLETGRDAAVDAVLVVTAPAEVQRARVSARPGMTDAMLAAILNKQMPDAEKRRRAHFIIDTGRGIDAGQAGVAAVRRALLAMNW